MSFIKTYQPLAFSQINLDSGEKILISRGEDARIFKLGFLNIATGTIHVFDNLTIARLISKLGLTSDYIKYLAEMFVKCKNTQEVKNECIQLENKLKENE